jgi:hypothetical protein
MSYGFDTSSIRSLQHFYRRVFRSIWDGLEVLVSQGLLTSTREVQRTGTPGRQRRRADVGRGSSRDFLDPECGGAALCCDDFSAEALPVVDRTAAATQGNAGRRPVCYCLCEGSRWHGCDRGGVDAAKCVAYAQAECRENTQRLCALWDSLYRSRGIHAPAGMEVLICRARGDQTAGVLSVGFSG